MRRLVPVVALLGMLCVALAAGVVLHEGGGGQLPAGAAPTTLARAAGTPIPAVPFRVVRDELHTAAGVEAHPGPSRAAVLDVLERYVQLGSLTPMRRGRIGRGLEQVFSPDAFARAAGPDRGALFDEGAPVDPATTPVRAEAALVGVADPDSGRPAVVVARIVVQLAQGDGGVDVLRSAELTLVPAGRDWVIDAYSVRVTRAGLPAPLGTGAASS